VNTRLKAPPAPLPGKLKKVRYLGLRKNTARLEVLFALANLVIAKKRLLRAA